MNLLLDVVIEARLKLQMFDYVTFYLYFFLRGGLRPTLRPSINCGPMRNPDITKG